MRVFPTASRTLTLIRWFLAFGAALAVWLYCSHLNGLASAQTGMIVPVDIQVSRDLVRWLWFPFSWMPEPRYINDFWSLCKSLLIGVPYAALAALPILWLFRPAKPNAPSRRPPD